MKKIGVLIGAAGVVIGLGIFFSLRGQRKMIAFSKALVGQQEISGNLGFQNTQFEALIKEVIERKQIGDEVEITFYRNGQIKREKVEIIVRYNHFSTTSSLMM